MSNNIFNIDFIDFLKCFEKNKVEYILVGGYSVILHGYSRTTGDMDLWVSPTKENYEKILKAFECFGMPLFGMTLEKFLNTKEFDVFEYGRPPVSIDLLTKVKGLTFKIAKESLIRYQLNEELTINLLHINQLIEAKKSAGRPKDLDDLEHLEPS